MDIIDTEPVDFGTSVDNLPWSDPFLVLVLLADKSLYVIDFTKVVNLEGIFRIDFL